MSNASTFAQERGGNIATELSIWRIKPHLTIDQVVQRIIAADPATVALAQKDADHRLAMRRWGEEQARRRKVEAALRVARGYVLNPQHQIPDAIRSADLSTIDAALSIDQAGAA